MVMFSVLLRGWSHLQDIRFLVLFIVSCNRLAFFSLLSITKHFLGLSGLVVKKLRNDHLKVTFVVVGSNLLNDNL